MVAATSTNTFLHATAGRSDYSDTDWVVAAHYRLVTHRCRAIFGPHVVWPWSG
jgi:hypothetical protein